VILPVRFYAGNPARVLNVSTFLLGQVFLVGERYNMWSSQMNINIDISICTYAITNIHIHLWGNMWGVYTIVH
jgi:hypothetical protein